MKFRAFTLAEVLVTLGIIGVVSAMTIPTLMQNHQRSVYITQLHKVSNELSQAALQAITDSNAISLKESSIGRDESLFFSKYFKVVKDCSITDTSTCFSEKYSNLNGTEIRLRDSLSGSSKCVVISSGSIICIANFDGNSYSVLTDVNGKSGPNILGRDLFSLILKNDGSISIAGDVSSVAEKFDSNCAKATSDSYGYCFAKILDDGWKMDY